MNNARLDHRFQPGRLDHFGKPSEPVNADDEHVPDTAVAELGADRRPELRTHRLLDPDPEDVFDALHIDADGDVRGLVADMPAVTDLDHQSVQVDHRVERLQRPALPLQHLVGDLLGNVRDRLMAESTPSVDTR